MPSRTSEFKSSVESARLRLANAAGGGGEHKQRLLSSRKGQDHQKSEFARNASNIAKEIQNTMGKLEKLAQLAKRKTLFDDRPVEISELTYIIKRDIASLNQQIAKLQSITANNASGGRSKQADEHNNNVLVMLQGKLASTSMGFKDVLEVRTQNMKASKARTDQFGYTSNAQASSAPSSVLRARYPSIPTDSVLYQTSSASSSSLPNKYEGGNGQAGTGARRGSPALANGGAYDPKGKGRMSYDHDAQQQQQNDYLALDMGGGSNPYGGDGSMQQMQMQQTQQDQYLGQRATAIESIESTISELGQIFSQLATMVAQQGETVQRIDADTSDIANNVSGAQRELLKYYANISGNRALMLKVFGILIVFFLIFTLVT